LVVDSPTQGAVGNAVQGPRRARVWHVAGSAGERAAPRRHLDDRSSKRLGTGIHGRDPENAKDLHRKLTAADDLSEVLAWREERYPKEVIQILISEPAVREAKAAQERLAAVALARCQALGLG
jgi:hypothetical protein